MIKSGPSFPRLKEVPQRKYSIKETSYLATGTTTNYIDSRTTKYVEVFLVGGGGSGHGSATQYAQCGGGGSGGVGAFRIYLSELLYTLSGGEFLSDIFTLTTAVGSGGTGSTGIGSDGGFSSVTLKSNNSSRGIIFKAGGGLKGALTTEGEGGVCGQVSATSNSENYSANMEQLNTSIIPIPLLGNTAELGIMFYKGQAGVYTNEGDAGIYASVYATSTAGGLTGGAVSGRGGHHSGIQLPDWVAALGISTGTPGDGATDSGGGGASFNGAGGKAIRWNDTASLADATGYGGGGGGCNNYSGGTNPAGDGAPGVIAVRVVRN